ncbi:frequency clock protein [Bisporella sp. PMI_857]|nr:frequency clock protein [Bisporella sp. PMI_857]
MEQTSTPTGPHARRRPAHLSISLRHDNLMGISNPDNLQLPLKLKPSGGRSTSNMALRKKILEKDQLKHWFDTSNTHHAVRSEPAFVESDSPPHFLHNGSSGESSDVVRFGGRSRSTHLPTTVGYSITNGSRSDDLRSVIDDLTIENRKLKEKLKRYKSSYRPRPPLEKDKLFEIKIHGLPADRRRELEATLSAFATSVSSGGNNLDTKNAPLNDHHIESKNVSNNTSHNPSSLTTSTSTSRLVDSGYASMANSGPTHTSISVRQAPGHKPNSNTQDLKTKKIESYLDDIPEGLLPKNAKYTTLTDRQRKKIVVQRLEELFAGRHGSKTRFSQPMQQQEVSNSAAKADRDSGAAVPDEGVREAHMLKYPMELDMASADEQVEELKCSSEPITRLGSPTRRSFSSEQRPTRPLDLDPDRAQIPSDNFEYIRHLGLSAPQLARQESKDAPPDADGWIYLNLLMNMAQLHIINVTIDFVRLAIVEVSEKFQLSRDGKKVRWRGGTERTRLSSDSEHSSTWYQSPPDSDDEGEAEETWCKEKTYKQTLSENALKSFQPDFAREQHRQSGFHYQPVLRRQFSSEEDDTMNIDSDSYPSRYSMRNAGMGKSSSMQSQQTSSSQNHPHGGAIVFYSGARFFTDLSGDRGHRSSASLSTRKLEINEAQEILGCKRKRTAISRSSSDSSLPARPFKYHTNNLLHLKENSVSPEPLATVTSPFDFSPNWSLSAAIPETSPQSFDASGIGATQPADHFLVKVRTRHRVLAECMRIKLSEFPSARFRPKVSHRTVPQRLLNTFRLNNLQDDTQAKDVRCAAPNFHQSLSMESSAEEFSVKTEIIRTEYKQLKPSPLPAPSNYYGIMSGSDSSDSLDSLDSSDSESKSRLIRRTYIRQDRSAMQRSVEQSSVEVEQESDSGEVEDDEYDDEDEDERSPLSSGSGGLAVPPALEANSDMPTPSAVASSAMSMDEESEASIQVSPGSEG